jgi:alpha-galactosidase
MDTFSVIFAFRKPEMRKSRLVVCLAASVLLLPLLKSSCATGQNVPAVSGLAVHVDARTGEYSLGLPSRSSRPVVVARVAAEINGKWIHSTDYPSHTVREENVQDDLGEAHEWAITHSGLQGEPDLLCHLRAYPDKPFGDVQLSVRNKTGAPIHVESLRVLEASGSDVLNLAGPSAEERVLSDSFSEDRPAMLIHDLSDSDHGVHRGVGSQLVYNRQSGIGFYAAALTSDRFLTVLRLSVSKGPNDIHATGLEVDSTGTTELTRENSLLDSPAEDRVTLSLPVAPGESLASERVLLSVDKDYHRQLETYGSLIRQLHHARVSAETPMGWWSWTAYYFGLSDATALSNAEWLAQNLKPLGYTFFHIDEGYQYARGEYTTPDEKLFPNGVASLEHRATALGLTPGIWTAPFEVSERSWLYEHHPDWLIHNAEGKPIHAGSVTDGTDKLYLIDPTNPGAQKYLRTTYRTLVNDWGIRYIKLDFMEDSAVEGAYYKPNTTALEAQRIGLGVIREAVGNSVLLDKDGCEMLNPVGYVDFGRISQDTGHTFDASRDAASGMAARFYMNRNYFVADPDAFTVSTQTVDDQSWHGGQRALTLDEAQVSIALAAVSGGMFEIGDDLPTLTATPERIALLKNSDLLDMVRFGHASTPLDLMTYRAEDRQPSLFLLHEGSRQSILTMFNWTEKDSTHKISLADLGLSTSGYSVHDMMSGSAIQLADDHALEITQPEHSVRMLKIVDSSTPAAPLKVKVRAPEKVEAGVSLQFQAEAADEPILHYSWDFGDGISLNGHDVHHAYTHEGEYHVTMTATGLNGVKTDQSLSVTVTGAVATKFVPADKVRYRQ